MFNFYRRPVSNLQAGIIPLLYIVLVPCADHFSPGTTITPALSTLGLLFMSFWLPTSWMIFWVLVYTGLVFGVFHNQTIYDFANRATFLPHDFSFNIRIISFFSVGLFCIAFSVLLNRSRRTSRELHEILSSIPDPLVTSDAEGRILFANSRMLEKVGLKEHELRGEIYFDRFAPKERQGAIISNYLQRFEGCKEPRPLCLEVEGEDFLVETILLSSSAKKSLLTIFNSPLPQPILLGSFPRSGNTFFRIVAKKLFGVRNTSLYEEFAVASDLATGRNAISSSLWLPARKRNAIVASLKTPLSQKKLKAGARMALVKTHEVAGSHADDIPAIYLVRDGRDALVSFAHYAREHGFFTGQEMTFSESRVFFLESKEHFGGWSQNVISWLERSTPPVIVRFEELIAHPVQTVTRSFAELGVDIHPANAEIPTFEQLKELSPHLFRKGMTGGWRDEMSLEIEELFWSHQGAAMEALGYER